MKPLTPKQKEFVARTVGEAHAANAGGRHDAAIGWCRKALDLAPELPEGWYNLGLAYAGKGLAKEATIALGKAAALVPDIPDALNSIGLQLFLVGEDAEAEQCLRRCLALAPGYAFAHSNLGLLRKRQNRLDEAVSSFREAINLQPLLAAAHANLGGTLNLLRSYAEGEAACRRALEIDPKLPAAWGNLGSSLLGLNRTDEAEAACRKALALDPALPEPHVDLAAMLMARGAYEEAIGEFDKALENVPDDCETISSRLFCLNYMPRSSPADMLAASRDFERAASRNVTAFTAWRCVPDPGRKLRIGLVSGDLRQHPVGYLLQGPLRELDRTSVELVAYSNHRHRDELTAELESRCAAWVAIAGRSDEDVARQVQEDGIDILVDLSGHTGHGRLPMFAWKPAPVQVAWLGYFATTGLRTIDWRIADRWVVPPGEEGHFTEKIWRLPGSCFCFSPPREAPAVTALPFKANGFVTYGCFNNLAKMNDEVIGVWSRILRGDATSRLLLKAGQLAAEGTRRALADRLERHGIGEGRVLIEAPGSYADYLAAYGRVDIALDPFPYPGGATTAEGLWMGVPVVTLAGDRFISHQGESLLHAAGQPEWIASSRTEYVDIALRAASDREALASVRAGLRDRVAQSPLFDAALFARHLESAWRGMWQQWCTDGK